MVSTQEFARLNAADCRAWRRCCRTIFEDVVFQAFPDLQQWKSRLTKAGASAAMMCGSGAALFGLFSDRRSAIRARDSLRGLSGNSYLVRTLSRRSYRRLWSSSDSVS